MELFQRNMLISQNVFGGLCISGNICISAFHIPRKQNAIADFISRSLNENTYLVRTFDFEPEIDLFESYLNYQVENYISWFLDPKTKIIDAFRIDRSNKKFYAFLPFSLIGPTLVKIRNNQTSGIMIMPRCFSFLF